jgi:hypothetical protein
MDVPDNILNLVDLLSETALEGGTLGENAAKISIPGATKGASVSLLVTSLFSIVARGFLKNIIVDSCIKSFLPKQKFNLVSKSCAKAKYCKITKENKY